MTLTLTVDKMLVNKATIFVTFDKEIVLLTVEFMSMKGANQLAYNLLKVVKSYSQGCFHVQKVLMDM